MELSTERLALRVPAPEDAAAYAAYLARNREHFAPAMPAREPSFYEPATWEAAFASLRADVEAERRVTLLLRDAAGEIAGDVSLSCVVRGPLQQAFLGYKLDRDRQGEGLMSEAVSAVIDFAFGPWNLHRLSANYRPENTRSGRLLRRLGFVVEGYARDYLHLDGAWRDHVLTALYNPRWKDPG